MTNSVKLWFGCLSATNYTLAVGGTTYRPGILDCNSLRSNIRWTAKPYSTARSGSRPETPQDRGISRFVLPLRRDGAPRTQSTTTEVSGHLVPCGLAVFITLLLTCIFSTHIYAESEYTIAITPTVQSRVLPKNITKYFIVVEGTTNLPDRSILKVNLHYAYPLGDNQTTVDMPDLKNRSRFIDTKKCWVKKGQYIIEFGPYSNYPPPIEYYIAVTWESHNQAGEATGSEKAVWNEHLLRLGGLTDAEHCRHTILDTIQQQAFRIPPMFCQLHDFFIENLSKPISPTAEPDNKKKIAEWQSKINDACNEIITYCTSQDELKVFNSLAMYKNMTASMANGVKELAQVMVDAVSQPPAEQKIETIRQELEAFGKQTEEDLASLGWVKPFDKELLQCLIEDSRQLMTRPMADSIPTHITESLLALNGQLPITHYDIISHLASNISEWVKAKSGPKKNELKQKILNGLVILEQLLNK